MARDEELTHNQVLARLRLFAWERARGRSPGSDRLIRAGLDALLAGVDGPSVPLLAGLTRREEPDAPALFDRVAEELGIQVPRDPTVPPARNTWMQMRHLAGWIADGSLEATVGAGLLRSELVDEPHLVDEFATVFQCADLMAEWDPSWSMPFSALVDDFVEAAKALTAPATTTATHTGSDAHGGSHTGSDTGSDTGWDSHTNSRTGSDMDTVSDTMSTGSPRVGAAGESGRVEERRVG